MGIEGNRGEPLVFVNFKHRLLDLARTSLSTSTKLVQKRPPVGAKFSSKTVLTKPEPKVYLRHFKVVKS